MSVKVIIFDFDGTLADTLELLIKIINRLAGEFGYKPASKADIERLQNLTSREIIRQSGIAIFKIPSLLRRIKAELNKEIHSVLPIKGIEKVLKELKQKGYRLGILTSNSPENVKIFLENNKLTHLFDYIYSGSTIFGKSKIMKWLLKQENLKPQEVIYVGDEVRDIEAAKKSRIGIIAVSWGFHSKQLLAKQQPDCAIDEPAQLIEAIARLQK